MQQHTTKEYLALLAAISEVAIIAYTDSKGTITYANDNFCNISGYTQEELLGKNHRVLNSGEHSKEFFDNMYKTIFSGHVWRGEIKNKNKNGTFYWADTQIVPIYDETKKVKSFVSVRFDITKRKNMQDSLVSFEKMAILGEMAAVVAHEINTPLTTIDMCAETMMTSLKKGELNLKTMEKKLNNILISVSRVSKLVRGLKTFSRTSHKEEYALISLKNFVQETLSFLEHKCEVGNVALKLGEIPDIEFECSPDQISQVLINLVNNAYDAIFDLKEKWIEVTININWNTQFITFSVKDCGTGIPDEIAEKILTPFFTTKDIGKGTGLGLSVSKEIIESHSGKLGLLKDDKNTHFYFTLPIRQTKPEKNAA